MINSEGFEGKRHSSKSCCRQGAPKARLACLSCATLFSTLLMILAARAMGEEKSMSGKGPTKSPCRTRVQPCRGRKKVNVVQGCNHAGVPGWWGANLALSVPTEYFSKEPSSILFSYACLHPRTPFKDVNHPKHQLCLLFIDVGSIVSTLLSAHCTAVATAVTGRVGYEHKQLSLL